MPREKRGWDGNITDPIDLIYIFNLDQDVIVYSLIDESILDGAAIDLFDRPPNRELVATIEVGVRGHLAKSGRHTLPLDSLEGDKGNGKQLKTYRSRGIEERHASRRRLTFPRALVRMME